MSFPRYPEYKNSGVEWLGEVPEHWKMARIKSILDSPLKYGANESAELDDTSLPRFIRITDIDDNGKLRDETFKSLPVEVAEPYLLKDGDILLARSGATVGKSFIYSEIQGAACFAGYLIRARVSDQMCSPSWLYYFCQTDGYWSYILGSQIQATIQNVSAEKYANFYLSIPELSEQKAILSFIDCEKIKIDTLIGEQEQLIALLKEKRQAVIYHAVTKGLDPSVKMKDSGVEWLGEVPEHWDVLRLKRITALQAGETIKPEQIEDEGSFPVFGGNGFRGYTSEFTHDGDYVLVGRQGALCGNINYAAGKFWASEHAIVATPKLEVKTKWLGEMLRVMNLNQYSTSAAQPGISVDLISKLFIPAPNGAEQAGISGFIENETAKIDELIAEAIHGIELLKERRGALISVAMTGKIDVRDAEKSKGSRLC